MPTPNITTSYVDNESSDDFINGSVGDLSAQDDLRKSQLVEAEDQDFLDAEAARKLRPARQNSMHNKIGGSTPLRLNDMAKRQGTVKKNNKSLAHRLQSKISYQLEA